MVITHYQRLLDYIKPDTVHVLLGGRIVKTGGPELAKEIETRGFDWDVYKRQVEKEGKEEGEEIFKIHQPEFVSKINVIGQIDLAALNQSTRPKKKCASHPERI